MNSEREKEEETKEEKEENGWGNRFQFSSTIGDYFINYVVDSN